MAANDYDERIKEVDKQMKRHVSKKEFEAAVKAMIDYMWGDEEEDFLQGETDFDSHIFKSIVTAQAGLRQKR